MQPNAITAADLDVISQLSQHDLHQFGKMAQAQNSTAKWLEHVVWPVVEPGTPFIGGYHIDYIGEHLDAVDSGQIRYLIINAPRRIAKSRLASIARPTRRWAIDPGSHMVLESYAEDLMRLHSSERRKVLQAPFFRKFYPQAQMENSKPREEEYTNVSGGEMFGTMTLGTVIGIGGHITLDDPMSEAMWRSETKRKSVNNWIATNFGGCFNNPKTDTFVVIAQRLGRGDICDYLLERADWTHIVLRGYPMEAQTYVFPTSGRVVHQKAHEPLCPERMDITEIEARSRMLDGTKDCDGPNFMAQENQQPLAMTSTEHVQHEWLVFWHHPDSPLPPVEFPIGDGKVMCGCIPLPAEETCDLECQSWDLSADATKRAADTAATVWWRKGALRFLRDIVARKMTFLAQLDAVGALREKYPRSAPATLIENKANGPALINSKQGEWSGLIPINVNQLSKNERLNEVLPQFRERLVVLPHPAIDPRVRELIKQLTGQAVKQDLKDSVTQGLKYMGNRAPAQLRIAGERFAVNRPARPVRTLDGGREVSTGTRLEVTPAERALLNCSQQQPVVCTGIHYRGTVRAALRAELEAHRGPLPFILAEIERLDAFFAIGLHDFETLRALVVQNTDGIVTDGTVVGGGGADGANENSPATQE